MAGPRTASGTVGHRLFAVVSVAAGTFALHGCGSIGRERGPAAFLLVAGAFTLQGCGKRNATGDGAAGSGAGGNSSKGGDEETGDEEEAGAGGKDEPGAAGAGATGGGDDVPGNPGAPLSRSAPRPGSQQPAAEAAPLPKQSPRMHDAEGVREKVAQVVRKEVNKAWKAKHGEQQALQPFSTDGAGEAADDEDDKAEGAVGARRTEVAPDGRLLPAPEAREKVVVETTDADKVPPVPGPSEDADFAVAVPTALASPASAAASLRRNGTAAPVALAGRSPSRARPRPG